MSHNIDLKIFVSSYYGKEDIELTSDSDSEEIFVNVDNYDDPNLKDPDSKQKMSDDNIKQNNVSQSTNGWLSVKYNALHNFLCSFALGTCAVNLCKPTIKYRDDIFDTDTEIET